MTLKKTILTLSIIAFFCIAIGLLSVFVLPKTQMYKDFTAKKGGAISAIDLVTAYQANEQKADSLYNGKVIEITGVVASSSIEEGITVVNLKSNDAMAVVSISLQDKKEPLKPNETITIKGQCTGLLSDVKINEGVIIK
jgi:tRNA_anti-like